MKKSASTQGSLWAMQKIASGNLANDQLTDVIFEAMQSNPFKTEKARKEFENGVSDTVNRHARIRTRSAIYRNRDLRELGY